MRGGVNGFARVDEMAVEFSCVYLCRWASAEETTLTVVVVCGGAARGIVGSGGRVVVTERFKLAENV